MVGVRSTTPGWVGSTPGPAGVALFLLSDGRFPAGGYAHSCGVEEAIAQGQVGGIEDIAWYAAGVLASTGTTAAGLAAAACALASNPMIGSPETECVPAAAAAGAGSDGSTVAGRWWLLDAEADARIPSPAQRRVSRQLGRQLWRTASRVFPVSYEGTVAAMEQLAEGPHQPLALGVAVAGAGGSPGDAACLAGYGQVMTVVQAGVRLLGLDPVAVTGIVAEMAGDIEAIAQRMAADLATPQTGSTDGWPPLLARLPASGAPLVDHYGESHVLRHGTLFAS